MRTAPCGELGGSRGGAVCRCTVGLDCTQTAPRGERLQLLQCSGADAQFVLAAGSRLCVMSWVAAVAAVAVQLCGGGVQRALAARKQLRVVSRVAAVAAQWCGCAVALAQGVTLAGDGAVGPACSAVSVAMFEMYV